MFNHTLSKSYEITNWRLAFTLDFSPSCVHLFCFIYATDWLEVKYCLSTTNVVIIHLLDKGLKKSIKDTE